MQGKNKAKSTVMGKEKKSTGGLPCRSYNATKGKKKNLVKNLRILLGTPEQAEGGWTFRAWKKKAPVPGKTAKER